MKRTRPFLLMLCTLLVLCLSGCQVETDRGEKPGPDWSRGLRLGQTGLRQPVALQTDANGHVHLVWNDLSAPSRLRYVHIGREGHVLLNEQLDVDQPNLRRPQLLVDGGNRLHLAWLSRQEGVQRLYHTLVGPDGQTGAWTLLSDENSDVTGFQIYLAPGGEVAFVWAEKRDGGSSHIVHLFAQQPSSLVTLVEGGADPYVLADRTGTVHLTWMTEDALTARTIYYAELVDASRPELRPANGQELADFTFPEGGTYYGPVLGVDMSHVYVIWSIQNLGGGLTPTSAFAFYVTFEAGAYDQPGAAPPTRSFGIPVEVRPEYKGQPSTPGGYGFTELALLSAGASEGSEFVNTPAIAASQRGEVPVALSVLISSQADSQIRLATAVLKGGEPVGYQLASKSMTASLMPSIASGVRIGDAGDDQEGGLHLAWLDTAGFREFDVYYATTAPEARRWLDRTSTDDLVLRAGDLVFGVFSGLGLLPIAGIWTFPAMVWVVVFFIATGREELAHNRTKIGFAIAVVLYVGVKILLLPGLYAGTPFLYRVPPAWAILLGITVPTLILLVALAAVFIYARRAERATIFAAYLVFALTDIVLTLVLYSPGFFGTE